MRKVLVGAVLTALFLLSACASANPIWRVSNNDHELYLGGSVHILRESDYPLPEVFDTVYTNSDILVLEADIGAASEPQIAGILMARAMLPENKTLKDFLRPETYDALALKCAEIGVPVEMISRFTPSMAINILTVMQLQGLEINAPGADLSYYSRGRDEGKPMEFLETLEFQMDMLADMGTGFEDEYVLYSLSDMDETEESMEVLIDEWKRGVTAEAEAALSLMKKDFPSVYNTLFTERNNAWLLRIEEYLKTAQTEFVIVGFGHLSGPDGLPALLRSRGYTVKQVK
jgi:uncharacterized protein YbaP (TraB family)